jgi:hypothetical protein
MKTIPGVIRPVCWRPNIGNTEMFRRGKFHAIRIVKLDY